MKINSCVLLTQEDGSLTLQITIPKGERVIARVLADKMNEFHALNKDVEFNVVEKSSPRSKSANALMWACIGDIAKSLRADKWDVYLQMLKRYSKGQYIIVKENAVESFKRMWRECEEVGVIEVNGKKARQLLVYPGSSTMTKSDFAYLLDGIISEMKEIGLTTPEDRRIKEVIDAYHV